MKVMRAMRAAKRKESNSRDAMISVRATEETKAQAQAIKELMKVSSTSQVIRQLLNEKASQMGVA